MHWETLLWATPEACCGLHLIFALVFISFLPCGTPPKVYWEFTSPETLVLEYLPGTKINDAASLDR